jgi:glutathione reductase (NADPH)
MNYDFDLLTIGAGSGGVSCSRRAAGYGARVGIIERARSEIGGTCVLHGCVPKKLLVYGAHFAESFADAAGYGWNVTAPPCDWASLQTRKAQELARLNGIYQNLLTTNGVTILEGSGRLVDEHTVAVGDKTYTAAHILIATGSHPKPLAIPGGEYSITSDQALDLPQRPRRVAIIGAGYIGVEFAGIFHGFGAEVHLVYRRPWVLPHFDQECARHLSETLAAKGLHLHPGRAPQAIARHNGDLTLTLDNGETIAVDIVLNATGRLPNVAALGLADLGIAQHPDTGAIVIDEQLRTSVPHIYAVGDVVNEFNLTPYAIKQGRALADALFLGKPVAIQRDFIPTAVFSQPPLATVGLTEAAALSAFDTVDVYSTTFRPMLHTLAGRNERTLMKIIVDPGTNQVLGLHMVGQDAPEIVQGFATALLCGATKAQFDATIGIHPSSAEEFVTMTTKRTASAPPKAHT